MIWAIFFINADIILLDIIKFLKTYSPNHCFSKSPNYGGNTKKRGFTIDNLTVLKKKHTQLLKIYV